MLLNLPFLPFFTFFTFFLITTFYLFFSLKNIFKIFFLTEILLLITVIFLLQITTFYPEISALNYFYSQLILASAAAEGALFLGLFSHLYDQQFTNRVNQPTLFTQNIQKKNIYF
jgi:NADH:ubiquinone oxidoreductase subunit K